MIHTALAHYLTISATITLPALSVGLGQGLASKSLIKALDRQPAAHNGLNRIFIIAMAFTETAAILAVLMAVILLMKPLPSELTIIAQYGAAAAVVIPAFVVGLASVKALSSLFHALARQPLFDRKVLNLLLITQAIIQTPVIFGLVIGWLILQQATTITTSLEAFKLCAAGIALAIGSIGPTIGLASFAAQAGKSIGINRHAFDKILSFTFLSQAMIETPILFSLVTSLLLLFTSIPVNTGPSKSVAYLAAAFTIGFTTFGTGIASGKTARMACKKIGENDEHYSFLSRISLLSQTLIDTNAIYGLIIVLFLIYMPN